MYFVKCILNNNVLLITSLYICFSSTYKVAQWYSLMIKSTVNFCLPPLSLIKDDMSSPHPGERGFDVRSSESENILKSLKLTFIRQFKPKSFEHPLRHVSLAYLTCWISFLWAVISWNMDLAVQWSNWPSTVKTSKMILYIHPCIYMSGIVIRVQFDRPLLNFWIDTFFERNFSTTVAETCRVKALGPSIIFHGNLFCPLLAILLVWHRSCRTS